jgi:hypothetical protein
MSKLSLKTLELKKLPFGKFKFMVLLKRTAHQPYRSDSNAGPIEVMRSLLKTTCRGDFKLIHESNSRKRRVYTKLYLMEPMDLAMLKLVHHEKLFKIYKIKVAPTPEPL